MKRLLPIIAAFSLLCACSLEEKPASLNTRENFYKTEPQCRAALGGCYLPLNEIYTSGFLLATEACTDIWYSNSTSKDAALDVTPAKPLMGLTVWTYGYQGVMRCNECIECIASAENVPQDTRNVMTAEARVLRALYYHILTSFFNGVPFYTYPVTDTETMARIRTLPRTDANEIRHAMYQDLKENALPYFTMDNGYRRRGSEVTDHRAAYPLALMLMAKFAMWEEDWEAALAPLKELEMLYGELTEERYPLRETMWRFKNTAESIFEIQHDYDVDGLRYYGNAARMIMPRWDGGDVYDGVDISSLGEVGVRWAAIRSNPAYAVFRPATGTAQTENSTYAGNTMFDPLPLTYDEYRSDLNRYSVKIDVDAIRTGSIRGKKIDKRVYYVLGLGDLDSLAVYGRLPSRKEGITFVQTNVYGIGWGGPKFWCPGMIKSYDSNNYKIFRYADAVLMMAECYINLEDEQNALKYLNYTRRRAEVAEITVFNGFEALTAELRCERARELGGEFQRKFDLVRWGVWYEQTYKNTNSSGLKSRMKPCHRYYPIPDSECALSGGVLTNDEYLEYGM